MADSNRYHADAGRLWEADDDPEEATLLTASTLEYDPGAGMLRHTFTNVNDETLTVEVPVIASGNWNEFVASLPLWTERNDVTGEVKSGDDSD
jgi:hypothetical protein